MRFAISLGGDPVTATLKQGDLKPGRFAGRWSAYEVTSEYLPGVVFETNAGIRGTTEVVIEVAP